MPLRSHFGSSLAQQVQSAYAVRSFVSKMAVVIDTTAGPFMQRSQCLNVSKGLLNGHVLEYVKERVEGIKKGDVLACGFAHFEAGGWQVACVDGYQTAQNIKAMMHGHIRMLPLSNVDVGSKFIAKYVIWAIADMLLGKPLVLCFGDVFTGEQITVEQAKDFLLSLSALNVAVDLFVGDHHVDTIKKAASAMWHFEDFATNVTMTFIYYMYRL